MLELRLLFGFAKVTVGKNNLSYTYINKSKITGVYLSKKVTDDDILIRAKKLT